MRLIDADALKVRTTLMFGDDTHITESIFELIDYAPTVELNESIIQEVLNKRCMTAVTNEYLIALQGNAISMRKDEAEKK